jgi:translation initiation factor IF-3
MKTNTALTANRNIRHKNVRIVTESGSQVLPTFKAIEMAEDQGLDLVLVNEQADPPVCKIVDLAKYSYELKIKEKEAARHQRESRIEIKEVQFKPNIDEHDFDTKVRSIAKFLGRGNKVKLMVQFRGRERQHTELGFNIIDRVVAILASDAELDGKPQFSGNRITAMLKGTKDGTKVSE